MAIGRIIKRQISEDHKINNLSCAESMLAITWAMTHLDRDGRITGEPRLFLKKVLPFHDISTETMQGYIDEWVKAKLVSYYEVDGEKVLHFPNFMKHQVIRYSRESESIYPAPPGEKPKGKKQNPTGIFVERLNAYMIRVGRDPVDFEKMSGSDWGIAKKMMEAIPYEVFNDTILRIDKKNGFVNGYFTPKSLALVKEVLDAIRKEYSW